MPGEAGGGVSQGGSTGDGGASTATSTQSTTPSGGQGQPSPQAGQQSNQQTAQRSDNSLSSGFLQQVPEEHRPLLEPYVKQWDAGVTRRFQELHSQISPFQELLESGASIDDVKLSLELYSLLDSDPQQFLKIVQEAIGESGQGTPPVSGDSQVGDDMWDGVPDGMRTQIQQMQDQLTQQSSIIEQMASYIVGEHQMSQQATEDQELDTFLTGLREQIGDYDESTIVSWLAAGIPPHQIADKWNDTVQKILGSRESSGQGPSAKVPAIISGGGAVPNGSKPVQEASPSETRDLVAEMLAASNRQGR